MAVTRLDSHPQLALYYVQLHLGDKRRRPPSGALVREYLSMIRSSRTVLPQLRAAGSPAPCTPPRVAYQFALLALSRGRCRHSRPNPHPCNARREKASDIAARRETIITFGPPDSTTGTPYRVHFSWAGSDVDGIVDHFDFIMVDHRRARTPSAPAALTRSSSSVPAFPGRPRPGHRPLPDSVVRHLGRHVAPRSAAPARASTGRRPGPCQFELLPQRFFVRAGWTTPARADPTPVYRSSTRRPTPRRAALAAGAGRTTVQRTPPTVVFQTGQWFPVVGFASPKVASRYVIIDSKYSITGSYSSYPESLYVLPQRFQWSDWQT